MNEEMLIHFLLTEAELQMISDLAAAEVKKAKEVLNPSDGLLKDWIDGYVGIMEGVVTKTKRAKEHHERQMDERADGKIPLRDFVTGKTTGGYTRRDGTRVEGVLGEKRHQMW